MYELNPNASVLELSSHLVCDNFKMMFQQISPLHLTADKITCCWKPLKTYSKVPPVPLQLCFKSNNLQISPDQQSHLHMG